MSRREDFSTCSACGDVSSLVRWSIPRDRLLCPECLGELEHGIIPEVISGRIPAHICGRSVGDEGGAWDNAVRLWEGG